MAETSTSPATEPEDETGVLDLRDLAAEYRPVLTAAGRVLLRRMSTLGPVPRTRVIMAQMRAAKAALALDQVDLSGDAWEASLEKASEASRRADDELLRLILVDPPEEVLEAIPVPERVGLIAAFFGAAPEEARGAADDARTLLEAAPSPGVKRRRGSRGSTGATRNAG